MKKPTFYVNPVYPQPERQTGTIWEQAAKKKRAKYLIYKYLTLFLVPLTVLFSNQFLEDLDKIWELRQWIPDPTKPILPPKSRK